MGRRDTALEVEHFCVMMIFVCAIQEEHLQPILDEERYEYVLERACAQFEPDDPTFIRVIISLIFHLLYSLIVGVSIAS